MNNNYWKEGSFTFTYETSLSDVFSDNSQKDVKFIHSTINYEPKNIYYIPENETTTVEWQDGTKTTVKCNGSDEFSEEFGFMAALTKKIFGGRQSYMKMIDSKKKIFKPKSVKKAEKGFEVFKTGALYEAEIKDDLTFDETGIPEEDLANLKNKRLVFMYMGEGEFEYDHYYTFISEWLKNIKKIDF